MIGARPALGRVFTTQDEAPASPPVIILSHAAWQQYLGGDPNIVGTELAMDSVLGPRVEYRYTVIGVMPADFAYPDRQTLFWLPFRTRDTHRRAAKRSARGEVGRWRFR